MPCVSNTAGIGNTSSDPSKINPATTLNLSNMLFLPLPYFIKAYLPQGVNHPTYTHHRYHPPPSPRTIPA